MITETEAITATAPITGTAPTTPTQEVEEYGPMARRKVHVNRYCLSLIRKALEGVVEDPHGTGRIARIKGIQVAGKTGTAQVIGSLKAVKKGVEEERFKDHAWFICFAPVEDPSIVVGVLVEHGGHGSSGAAPLARRVLEAYFFGNQAGMKIADKKEGRN
jgi:penicillin-binding protein 2